MLLELNERELEMLKKLVVRGYHENKAHINHNEQFLKPGYDGINRERLYESIKRDEKRCAEYKALLEKLGGAL